MSEFSAFLMGMLLADSRPLPSQTTKKGKLNSNIALQDVIFCQSLRNVIDGLEEYVINKHPSPLEFIIHLLPGENFEEPYTEEEKQIIANNKKSAEDYVRDINLKLIARGEKWENLSAVKMIWQDETHTPDIDHLDLLFGDSLLSKPVKHNGRLYEYNTTVPLDGLAKGFFATIPAKLILSLCLNNTREMIASYGYQYDFTRFEYNRQADKFDRMDEWKKKQRAIEYKRLLRTNPTFCKSTWSDSTSTIKKSVPPFQKNNTKKCLKRKLNQRDTEVCTIYNKLLSKSEQQEFYQTGITHITQSISYKIYRISFICNILGIALSIAIFLIGFFVCFILELSSISVFDSINAESIAIAIIVLVSTFVLWYCCNRVWNGMLPSKAKKWYLKTLQKSYYHGENNTNAKLYEKLLERIKK